MTGYRVHVMTVAVVLAVAAAVSPVHAQEQGGFAREGAYIGVAGLPEFTIKGDLFTGGNTYYKAGDVEQYKILPRLNTEHVLRSLIGFRARPFAIEVSYDRAVFQGEWLDLTPRTVFNAVNIDGKVFFLTRGRIQPHAVVGMAFHWLTVKDGTFPDTEFITPIGNASFKGPGLNTEVGVTAFVTPRAGVSVGYLHRIIWFRRVRGTDDEARDLKPPFHAMRGQVVVMGFYTF